LRRVKDRNPLRDNPFAEQVVVGQGDYALRRISQDRLGERDGAVLPADPEDGVPVGSGIGDRIDRRRALDWIVDAIEPARTRSTISLPLVLTICSRTVTSSGPALIS
jgi:hypothetical protein